jgi:tetratricopeptide (TPR) repeat protein
VLIKAVTAEQAIILISLLALVVSVATVVISIRKDERNNRAVIRQQMNALVLEMTAVVVEAHTMTAMPVTTAQERDRRTFTGMLVVQKAFPLSMQAVSLINQAPEIMTASDFMMAGDVSRVASNWSIANQCYEIAVRRTRYSFSLYKVSCRRGYAKILSEQGRHDEARELYREALGVQESTHDIYRHMNGYTYATWYISELQDEGDRKLANYLYLEAEKLYNEIINPNIRRDSLQLLEGAKAQLEGLMS